MKKTIKRTLSCTLSLLCAAASVTPCYSECTKDTADLNVKAAASAANDSKFTANDYSEKYDTVKKHVEFKINTAEISADELEAMGYTISEDRTVASKDAVLARITYTFDKLPSTLEELRNFSMKSNVQGDHDYGMFAPMAATIIALHTYGTDRNEACKMLDYIYGPDKSFTNVDSNFLMGQFATASNKVLQNCYFGGAKPENGYTPDEPFTITLEEGPYTLKASNGKPERHMSFIYFAGADTERYMDVFKSSDDNWYAFDSNYKHLMAAVKAPVTEKPDEPVNDVPDNEKFYKEKYDTVNKHVEFKINTAEISANELEAMGYTISEDRTVASKDVTLAKITYTFDKLPSTLEELRNFSMKSNVQGDYDYGMFAPMAATIIALHTYGTNKDEAYRMLDYIYGPNQSFTNFDKQFIQTQFATAANKVLQNCYFGGAKPENGYTPDEPFTITLEEGPYTIKASNGNPERHMSFIYFDGADTERYMDVFKSSGGTWYAFKDNYKHLLASVKTPVVELPDEPVDEVPDSEKYYSEKHDTVTKHVEFEINTKEISADELEAMGYTISANRKVASKDVNLAKITYTFDKLPSTLEELKKFSLKSKVEGDFDYGMFAPMAATIIALHTYGTDKEEAYRMLDYIYGPNQSFTNFDKQFIQTQFATAANKVLQNCYFGGAKPENGYTPDEPFTITLEEGPYFMKAANGYPERHMSFVYFDGADTERYMDVFKSSGGTWYGFKDNYKHLLASVKPPVVELPDEPADDVPDSEKYYSEKHDKVEKHVEFEINKSEVTPEELEAMGYTVSKDRRTASKDVTLAKITYTFDKLPSTLEELKKFSLKSKTEGDFDYGMFAPMAATIIALHTYGTDKEEAYRMLDYIYGPNQSFTNFDKQFIQTQFATAANKVLQNCYFGGAKPENGYTPDEPFTITLEEGPYFMKAANGKPERHMSLIYFDGADTERYMDVFKSSGGTWYAYESNYKHLLANVKPPTGTAPVTTPAVTTVTEPVTTTPAATTAVTTTITEPVTTTAATTSVTRPVTTAATTTVTKPVTTTAVTTTVTEPITTTASTTAVTKPVTTTAVTTTVTEPVTTTASTTTATKPVTTTAVTTTVTKPVTTTATTTVTEQVTTTAATTTVTEPVTTTASTTTVTKPVTTTASTTTVTKPVTTTAVTTTVTEPVTTTASTTTVTKPVTTTAVTTTVTEPVTTTASTTTVTEPVTTTASTTTVTQPVTTTATTTVTEPVTTTASTTTVTQPVTTTTVTTTVTEPVTTTASTTTVTEPVTTTVTTPSEPEKTESVADRIIDAEPENVESAVFDDETITLDEKSEIKIIVPEKMAFSKKSGSTMEYTFRLSDFDMEDGYFEYAAFGLNLPEGFEVDAESVKSSLKGNVRYAAPDSDESSRLDKEAGMTSNGGYIVFSGIDTRSTDRDAEIFTVTLTIPASMESYVNKIGITSLFGRFTDKTEINSDGTIIPHVALVKDKSGNKCAYTETKYLTGKRGDVDLDHKVTQIDATVLLKKLLAADVFGSSNYEEIINTDEAGESSDALSDYLGNVDDNGDKPTQIDATIILKAILAADMAGEKDVTDEIWESVI